MGSVRLDQDVHELLKQRKLATGASIEYLANNVLRDGLAVKSAPKQGAPRKTKEFEATEEERQLIDHLNFCAQKNYTYSKSSVMPIRKRLKESAFDECIKVIEIKSADWRDSAERNKYLRPETLFGGKFESYLNQKTYDDSTRGMTLQDELTDRSWAK